MFPIVMCGVPRSGSTLVWQILRDVFPDQDIPKTHPDAWDPDGSAVVATIRNPMDIAASLFRVRLSRGGADVGGWGGINTVLRRVKIYFDGLPKIYEDPHIILRYEDFWNDYGVIFDAITQGFGIPISVEFRSLLMDRYNIKANKTRADQLPDFNEYDEDGIHGDHIGPIVPGTWSSQLPSWSWEKVSEVCAPIANEWGYA